VLFYLLMSNNIVKTCHLDAPFRAGLWTLDFNSKIISIVWIGWDPFYHALLLLFVNLYHLSITQDLTSA